MDRLPETQGSPPGFGIRTDKRVEPGGRNRIFPGSGTAGLLCPFAQAPQEAGGWRHLRVTRRIGPTTSAVRLESARRRTKRSAPP